MIKFDGRGHRLWSRQLGTSGSDIANGAATDRDSNVYVVGYTEGALGAPTKGRLDAWVIKFDRDGHRLWSRQPGTSALDAWVIKFDSNGHRLWSRQPGTSAIDFASGVATDMDGNVYIVGYTEGALGGPNKGNGDAWAIKFDSNGNQLWTRQLGTSVSDSAQGVAADMDGNVFVAGGTGGALGGANKGRSDAWVIKFDGEGPRLWSRQLGTSDDDEAQGVAADRDGNVGEIGLSRMRRPDAWVIKFDGGGRLLWSRQPGTNTSDFASGVATDMEGNVSVAGSTGGALGGPNKGENDAWVIQYAR